MSGLRWGVLGAATIAVRRVIPSINDSRSGRVTAIASRTLAKAQAAADALGIARAYGSYDDLLADPDIDVIYNPLPNHLHVPWSVRAMRAGKHVLCEKPLALSAAEAEQLRAVCQETGRVFSEAFMVRSHPQWQTVREFIDGGRIGRLQLITGQFGYFRADPSDVRSHPEWGGGVLMDIGCYPIMMSRWLMRSEPLAVIGTLDIDPQLGVDRLASVLMTFAGGQAVFTCGGQIAAHQGLQVLGSTGRIEVPVPFTPPHDQPAVVYLDDGRVPGARPERVELAPVDQYALQADRFAAAVRGAQVHGGADAPVALDDSIANMRVIDAVFRSARSGHWETP